MLLDPPPPQDLSDSHNFAHPRIRSQEFEKDVYTRLNRETR